MKNPKHSTGIVPVLVALGLMAGWTPAAWGQVRYAGSDSAPMLFSAKTIEARTPTVQDDGELQPILDAANVAPDSMHFRRGVVFYKNKRYPEAVRDFTLSVQANEGFALSYYYRGMSRSHLGDAEAALADYSLAIAYDPSQAKFYLKRGLLALQLGQQAMAVNDLNQTIKLEPTWSKAYLLRGSLQMTQGEYAAATLDFDTALGLDADLGLAYLYRGLALAKQGNKQPALEDFIQAQNYLPNDVRPYFYAGLMARGTQQYDAALEAFDEALKLDPNNLNLYIQRGLTKLNLELPAEACTDFQFAAILTNPENFDPLKTTLLIKLMTQACF
jgi:tetratricopeptide (TPR) repeat protein